MLVTQYCFGENGTGFEFEKVCFVRLIDGQPASPCYYYHYLLGASKKLENLEVAIYPLTCSSPLEWKTVVAHYYSGENGFYRCVLVL